MPAFVYRELAWAWIIILGALMITPDGIDCIACGPLFTKALGVVSIVIGLAGFVVGRRGTGSAPSR